MQKCASKLLLKIFKVGLKNYKLLIFKQKFGLKITMMKLFVTELFLVILMVCVYN